MNTSASTPLAEGSYVDWPAIFAGTVVAVAIGLLLAAFGTALGLSTITLDGSDRSSTFELILTALWLVLTLIAAYLAGGYITGRMRRRGETATVDEVTTRDGINGLSVWGLGTIASAILVANVVSFAANTAGNVAAGAGQAAGAVAEAAGSAVGGVASGVADVAGAAIPDAAAEDPSEYLSNQLLRPEQVDPEDADPARLARQAGSIVANVYRTGEVSDADRAYLASAVAVETGLSRTEAAARVDKVVTEAQEARQQAADAIETAQAEAQALMDEAEAAAIETARVARNAGILTAFALAAAALIAGVASFAGAVRGGRDRDAGRTFGGLRYTG
jgi:hypothetical protein